MIIKGDSERRFYQKITDLFATAADYDKDAPTARQFFAKVQNKLHYAVSHQTAAEIIYHRADSEKLHMGLTSWANSPDGKILKSDVRIAKNYLSKELYYVILKFSSLYPLCQITTNIQVIQATA